MFCPQCRTTCADCEIPLVSELLLDLLKPDPEYAKNVHLYSPQNEVELALLKSILDSKGVKYFVRNDNFGSMEVGPRIGLFNAKMIEVQDDHYERAKELLADYFEKTTKKIGGPEEKYSLFDKIRMVFEVLVFGWIMPGRIKTKSRD